MAYWAHSAHWEDSILTPHTVGQKCPTQGKNEIGARHLECQPGSLPTVALFPVFASPWVVQASLCCTAALLCLAAAWGSPSRSGRVQIPLLPSPQCSAQGVELFWGAHPQDLHLHRCEKVISRSPIILSNDSNSSGLTVSGHIFNFGNEHAVIEGWTPCLVSNLQMSSNNCISGFKIASLKYFLCLAWSQSSSVYLRQRNNF